MTTMAPLAMPANFKNSTCDIASITVAGNKVPLEAGKTDYSMDLNIMESEMSPAIEVIPYDLSTDITVNNISGDSGTATVTAVSHDGKATVQYNIALNITTLKPASLKSVTVDGTPLEGFDPNTLEYRINGKTTVPVIAFEKALETTQTTVIAATELPGTTVVKTKAADGSELTYKFQFTKTVEVPVSSVARSLDFNGYKVLQLASEPAAFPNFQQVNANRPNGPENQDYTYGTTGQMMLIKKTYGYFGFKTNLPAGVKIEKGEVTFTLLAEDRADNSLSGAQKYGNLHLDVYENTDIAWTEQPTGEYRDGIIKPAYTSSVINNEVDIPAQMAKQTYEQTITYQVDPAGLQGKSVIGLAAEIREPSTSYNSFITIPLNNTEKLPKLKLTYYKDYVEPEKLAFVTFDGKAYGSFDPDTLEYKIPSADGQTASPVIAATAGASSTKVTVKQASGFPGKATVTTEAADGKILTYTFLFMKTVEVTPVAAAASFTTGQREHLGVAQGTDVGTYLYDKKLADGSAGRINQPGRIFLANGSFDDKAHLLFRPEIPLDAVVDSAELDLSVSALGSIRHIDVYENTDTSWKGNATGTTEEAGPSFDSSKVLNSDIEIKADQNYYRYTYQLDPSLGFEGRNEISFTAFTRERGSWSNYAVLELREGLQPTLRINYYKEDSTAEEGQVTAVTVGGKRLEEFNPAQYEYVIKTDAGATEAPEIQYALADNTTATYTPATELPGTATIVTSGGLTYRFKLAKTIAVAPTKIAQKRFDEQEAGMPFQTGNNGDFESYTGMNYGFVPGTMLNLSRGSAYDGQTSYSFFYYDTALASDCVVSEASLTAYLRAVNGKDTATPLHIDILENTDTGWVSNPTAYAVAGSFPAVSADRINVSDNDLPHATELSAKTYQLKPEKISGRASFGIAVRTREYCSSISDQKYTMIGVKSAQLPVLELTYYKD
ncbi:hypothetical protein [Acetivibrio sp. MSJd-27]|uniref:hypothetical protein n=1 Tax=Acetivibrio sp. MSJd-27 TaxID=2841523 RepID=UPI001C10698B|nr:hypothetical protein [Acetivibrio sp. MSJd-27]MBU5449514.1 hypothetical protein [Acetivibrio sp. MSJd-27]